MVAGVIVALGHCFWLVTAVIWHPPRGISRNRRFMAGLEGPSSNSRQSPKCSGAKRPGASAAHAERLWAREPRMPKGPGAKRPGASAAHAERLWAREPRMPKGPGAKRPGASAAHAERLWAREPRMPKGPGAKRPGASAAHAERLWAREPRMPKGPGAKRPGASAAHAERLWAREPRMADGVLPETQGISMHCGIDPHISPHLNRVKSGSLTFQLVPSVLVATCRGRSCPVGWVAFGRVKIAR